MRHLNSSLGLQRGATLLVSLIMLVVLTLFAVAGFNLSSINLKIAGNFQQQRLLEAVAQQEIEQIISTSTPFRSDVLPANQTLCANGSLGCASGYNAGGYNVIVSAPKCNYWGTAKGYTKKIGELTPEDTDWELRAASTDALTGAQATVSQGVRMRLLAGNCPPVS